ncbi:hypothetical protein Plhal304r1_c078g0164621 [Plasmopara halstedii]
MVRKKRKGVVKEADATGAVVPSGVDLRQVLDQVPVNVSLPAAFGDNDLEAWYEALCSARGSLYEQLKILQLFRSHSRVLITYNDSDSSNTIISIWRLVFRLSVTTLAQPLRKNLELILDVLVQSKIDELRVVASQELKTHLNKLMTEANGPDLTAELRVRLLDRMLRLIEAPFVAGILVKNPETSEKNGDAEHLFQFVACCADQLEALGKPIMAAGEIYSKSKEKTRAEEENKAAAVSTNVVMIASERSGHALKIVIVLSTMKEVLDWRLKQLDKFSLDRLTGAFFRILKHCVLLLQTTVVHKDLLTQAGLAYCLVLRLLIQLSESSSTNTTKLLLQIAYPELHISSSDACSNVQLRAHIEVDGTKFGGLSRLAVYRGLLSSLTNHDLIQPSKTFGLTTMDQSLLNAIFISVQQFCVQESYNTRLFAFQILEAFLRRAVLILQLHKKDPPRCDQYLSVLTVKTLTGLTAAVLINWEHPSKKVNQFMASVFAHVMNYFLLSGDFHDWNDVLLPRLVELPSTSRAKYGSLTLFVAHAGAQSVLRACPTLLSSLLLAVGQKDNAAPAAANLFAQILDDLSHTTIKEKCDENHSKPDVQTVGAWRQLWLSDVINLILSRDESLRSRVVMYVVPLLLKKDPESMLILIQRLQVEASNNGKQNDADVALWAELEVLKFARKKLAPEMLVGVSMKRIECGLRHGNGETRVAAFDALCASLKSTSMPSLDELRLIKLYLVLNGKEIDSANLMNTLLGLKTVLIRIKEAIRLATKNVTNPNFSHVSLSKYSTVRDEFVAAVSFKQWIEIFIVTSVYPGAIPQRLTLGLEIFLLYIQLFGLDKCNEEQSSRNLLFTKQMVTVLLSMLISAWDSIRSLADTILNLYPDELPGYSTRDELATLLHWAVGLCGSPRQRESDAGALFIRLLFQKCSSAIQRFELKLQRLSENDFGETRVNACKPDVAFVLQLTHAIGSRIDALSPADIHRGESPLVHGLLLSLHYVLDSVSFDQLTPCEAADWPKAMTQVFTVIHQSMRASLAVVGDVTSGTGGDENSASFAGIVGEVSAVAKTSNSALRVDCRGHLIVENGDCGLYGENESENAEQRAVVSSWLAARECCIILELLVRRVPLPRLDLAPGSISFFSVEMAQSGGEALLNSLFELKHKGALAMAYQSFEGVCRAFLANGEHNSVLGGLPLRWADRLLERLKRSKQQFILRRSSGFAFSFVAILRAEPRNSAAVILPKVMSTLLCVAGEDTDAAETLDVQQGHHLLRARVHALNILKLICQDAVLAEDVALYIVDMFELAVRGFDCGSWAVRNSSMMLFAASMQRAIGDKRIADGRVCQQVACDSVFSRFLQLRGFLARELTRLLAHDSKPSNAFNAAARLGLYPLLLFLSRLRPGDEDDQRVTTACDGRNNLSIFVPLVMQCASQPTMTVRHMAAKVLASIVGKMDAASVLLTLCAELPRGICITGKEVALKSHNYVHGVLTQIRHLTTKYLSLKGMQNSPHLINAQAEVFSVAVSKVLPSIMWLWEGEDADHINPVIRAEAVAILNVILRFYMNDVSGALEMLKETALKEAFVQTIQIIQMEAKQQLLQRCESNRNAALLQSIRPGMSVLDRELVRVSFNLWTEFGSKQPCNDLVKKMLFSKSLQIRKEATKHLANKVVFADLKTNAADEFQALFINQYFEETHPKVRARQLQLLASFESQRKIANTQTQRMQLQMQLMHILNTSGDPRILAPALELLAILASYNQDPEHDASIRALCQEIELRSDDSQPLMLRQAAASALRHSRQILLHTKQKLDSDLALTGWMSAVQLLQDDNVHVRACARRAVLETLAEASKDPSTTNAFSGTSLSDAMTLPVAVNFVVSSFAHTEIGAKFLSKLLMKLIDAPKILDAYSSASGAKAQDWDNLYRRIFDSESNNYFVERDTLAQNLVHALFVRTLYDNESMHRLRCQILTNAASVLTILKQKVQVETKSSQWLGGITYYSDLFSPLFGLLAAAVAITTSSSCPLSAEFQSLAGQVRELAHEAYTMYSKDEAIHPLVIRALELLACTDQSSSTVINVDPVKELLYLTPYWKALTEAWAA